MKNRSVIFIRWSVTFLTGWWLIGPPLLAQSSSAGGSGSASAQAQLPAPPAPGDGGGPTGLPMPTPGMDGVTWDGKTYNLTDNKAVDAMFSAYLSEPELSFQEEKEYTALVAELQERLDVFRIRREGKKLLDEVLPLLKKAARHPRDGGICRQIYNAVGIDVQSKDFGLEKQRQVKALEEEIETLKWNLSVTAKPHSMEPRPKKNDTGSVFEYEEHQKVKKAKVDGMQTELEGKYAKLTALQNSIVEQAEDSRFALQRVILGLLVARRFDHVMVASSFYRLLYGDGDSEVKLQARIVEEAAQNAKKLRSATSFDRSRSFSEQINISSSGVYSNRTVNQTDMEDGITSMLPAATDALGLITGTKIKAASLIPETVTEVELVSQEAIDKCNRLTASVRGHLAQKDLDNALGRLREAFLAGEHLAVVRSFPWEQKQVLWKYKKTLEEARAGLASKDLGKARLAMEKLGQMTGDHPLSREFSEMANVQSISSLHLSRAKEAAARGDRETMNKELEEAAEAWPQNPDLADGSKKMLEQMSQQAQGKGELRKLIEQNNDSFIVQDKARFLAVAADDPKLLAQLQTILEKQMKSKTWQVKAEEFLRRGDAAGAWEQAEAGLQEHPGQTDLIQIRSDAAMRCPEYITAIERARQSERKDDLVAALGGYLAARSFYPGSELAKKEIQKLSDRLLQN